MNQILPMLQNTYTSQKLAKVNWIIAMIWDGSAAATVQVSQAWLPRTRTILFSSPHKASENGKDGTVESYRKNS